MFLRAFLLAIGALCVVLGGVFFYSWYGTTRTARVAGEARVETKAEAPRTVLAAAHPLARATLLRPDDFVARTLKPDERLQPGSLSPGQEQDFIGAAARRAFVAGEALIVSEFVKPGDRTYLASALRPGYRATSIFVDAAQSVSGLALPGDFVDVILVQSFDDKLAEIGRRTAGETVLRGVRVLATDQSTLAPSGTASVGGVEVRVPKTVTLELTDQQAKALMVASKLGSFELLLLPLGTTVETAVAEGGAASAPVWASDVSPALGQVAETDAPKASSQGAPKSAPRAPCPPVTGSTIDKSVRCVPSAYAMAPPSAAPAERPAVPGGPAVRTAPQADAGGEPQ